MRLNVCGLLIVSSFVFSQACNSTSFQADAPKKGAQVQKPSVLPSPSASPPAPAGDPPNQTLKLVCETNGGEAHLVTELKGTKTTIVRIEGEFCGVTATNTGGPLTVLFILDYSGSMNSNDPPIAGGGCGRLSAGQAIVSKLKAAGPNATKNVQLGLLAFGSDAMPVVNPAPLATFESSLTSKSFCSSEGGATNYEAAMAAAETMLASRAGAKIIYFISDGLPTVAGTGDPFGASSMGTKEIYQAGRTAAASLRQRVSDLTFNAIFLGGSSTSSSPSLDPDTVDPNQYLADIAGSPDHVRVVDSAQDLAAEIKTFEDPGVVALDSASALGTLAAPSFTDRSVKLAQLTPATGRPGVWQFSTEPFTLFGPDGKVTQNTVTLTIKGADGKSYKATAVINFTPGG